MGRSRSHALAMRLAGRRLVAMGMIVRGTAQAEVARRLHVTREAVRQWVEAWRRGGPAAIAPRPRTRRRRVDLARIADRLDASRPGAGTLTTARVRRLIERSFGVKYCASSARSILHRLGFVYSRKSGWTRARQRPGTERFEAKRRTG